jgi:cell wall-associated NlpC family hydrolase
MLHFVNGAAYSVGNHDAINEDQFSIKAQGTDCSGLISWLMGPKGLGIWHTSLATPEIANAPGLQVGEGRMVTVWNNKQPGATGHVFIQIGNVYFASEGGGVGVHQLPKSEVDNYLAHGSDGGGYEALHPTGL